MTMTAQEKEKLADRIVEMLKDPTPKKRIATLQALVDAGDEGSDGLNSVVLAVAVAMTEHLKR